MPAGATSPDDQQEFSDADFRVVATADQTKKLKLLLSGLTTATTRTWTVPDASGTVALTSDLAAYQPLDADLTSWAAITRASGFDTFAATANSANLRTLLSDETGTGAAVFAGGDIGAATATSINVSSGGAISTLTRGTYTPTLTNTTNVAASTSSLCGYAQIGDIVTVFGVVQIDATTTGLSTVLGVSLPVASTISATAQVGGAASAQAIFGNMGISGDTVNNRATVQGIVQTAANAVYNIIFSYRVV